MSATSYTVVANRSKDSFPAYWNQWPVADVNRRLRCANNDERLSPTLACQAACGDSFGVADDPGAIM